jgi:hypothetical protein
LIHIKSFGRVRPASHDGRIVPGRAAVYCVLVVRSSILVGGSKRTLRNEAPGPGSLQLGPFTSCNEQVWRDADQYGKAGGVILRTSDARSLG